MPVRDYPVRFAWAELSEQSEDLFRQLDPDQIEVFRSFFYSGVLWTMLNIMKRSARNKGKPSAADAAFFSNVRLEIDDFVSEQEYPVFGNA